MNLDFKSLNLHINIWNMNIKTVISEKLIFFIYFFSNPQRALHLVLHREENHAVYQLFQRHENVGWHHR